MSVDRGFTWMDDETFALIGIFSKEDIQQELNGSKRNIGVNERIASELSETGFRRTAYQCREKVKRLRKEYHLAKYCLSNNIAPKKPMKYFELVDKLFNSDSSVHANNIDLNFLSSENEDELHLTFNHESDASNSCTGAEAIAFENILPGPSSSPHPDGNSSSPLLFESKTVDASPENINSDDTLLLNGEQIYDLSDKDTSLENDSLWAPNVVLVENESENIEGENDPGGDEDSNLTIKDNENSQDFQLSANECFKDAKEPPLKKRRRESSQNWMKKMLNSVTETFLNYQETAESRFLERITLLEQERMKREENMQRLRLEFEERRRKEEQEHELKMLSLFGQFINQINGSDGRV